MSRDIKLLHPELQLIINEFYIKCKESNLNVLITETFRTKQEQDALYAQGRTTAGNIVTNVKYPNSAHCWGVAFDFCRNVRGREYDDSDGFFKKVGSIGKSLGLSWGGDWVRPVDKPHLQMKKYMPDETTKFLVSKYKIPDNFKKTWNNSILEEGEEVTQEQFNKMYSEMIKEQEKNVSVNPSPWAKVAWEWAVEKGLTDGTRPHDKLTRQESMMLFYTYYNKLQE